MGVMVSIFSMNINLYVVTERLEKCSPNGFVMGVKILMDI